MVLDNHILLCVHLRSIFLKAVKQKSCALTPLVYYCYGFKEAHPASNVTWVTLEIPLCKFDSICKWNCAGLTVQKNANNIKRKYEKNLFYILFLSFSIVVHILGATKMINKQITLTITLTIDAFLRC